MWVRFRKLDRADKGAIDSADFFKIPAVEYHKGYHKQSKALLIAKADLSLTDSDGHSALHHAAAHDAELVAVILRAGL